MSHFDTDREKLAPSQSAFAPESLTAFAHLATSDLMLAVVANIFMASPVLHLTICAMFVLLSSALILWEVNQIVTGGETNYVSATLSLYMSVYNLFSSLLQLRAPVPPCSGRVPCRSARRTQRESRAHGALRASLRG